MVRSLVDLCLGCVAQKLGQISQARKFLPFRDKEVLIERMCWHKQFTGNMLPAVTYHLFSSKLKRVCLEDNSQVTNALLTQLAKSNCQLTYLKISNCKKVTDAGLENLLKGQHALVKLSLKHFGSAVSLSGLKTVIAPQLNILNLKHCDGLTDAILAKLVQNCNCINKLVLTNCSKVTSAGIERVAELLQGHLEWLSLDGVNKVTDSGIIALSRCCPNLKTLHCHGCTLVGTEGFAQLRNCHLTNLDLSYCYKLADSDLAQFTASLHHIRSLSLCGTHVKSAGLLKAIEEMSMLTELQLCGLSAVTDDVIAEICSLTGNRLTSLDLSSCTALSERVCYHISRHCQCLQKLSLSLCRALTGVNLLPLLQDSKRASEIKSLIFSGCKELQSDVIEAIADHCHSLEVLLFAGVPQVEDSFVRKLAYGCRNLQYLTDDAICCLIQNCNLHVFVVSGITDLTDKIIMSLASHCCSTLHVVYLAGCAYVTPAAVRYLQDTCVNGLFIHHQIPNAPPDLLMAKNLDTGEYCKMSE